MTRPTLLPLWLTVTLAACSGGNPAAPTPTPLPTPQTVTLTGRLTATNGGQGLEGVQAALGAVTAATAANGQFTASMLPTASVRLSLTGATIIPRTLQVAMLTNRELGVDAIALGGGFDLNYYRQLARDGSESSVLQPLRRWTTNPSLYLQTGADARTLDMIEAVARASVSDWTGGRLSVATVEHGPGSRVGQAGWLTILFDQTTPHCGLSDVGLSGGVVALRLNCGCGGYQVAPTLIRHEVGHALGLYHVTDATDVMFPTVQCDVAITGRERYHAAIVYNRPVGNADPDVDSAGIINLAPIRKR